MRNGWSDVRLGEILAIDVEPVIVSPEVEYRLAGVYSFGRGLFQRDPLLGSRTAYKQLHRLRKGQLVLSKLKAWEGAVAVVGEAFDGSVLSPEFPTFSITGALDPGFLSLLCGQDSFWSRLRLESRGVGGRRERVHPRRLLEVVIGLPPLAEQRRIIDLVGALDHQAVALLKVRASVRRTLEAVREEDASLAADRVRVGDLIDGIDAGKSPPATNRLPRSGERAVLKVSAVRRGWFDADEAKVVDETTTLPDTSRLCNGDILITRANTRELVGAVCRVETAPAGYFLCDKTLRLHPRLDRVDPDFLVQALLSRAARDQIERGATGSTASMKNVSQQTIRGIELRLPPLGEQRRLSHVFAGLNAVGSQTEAQGHALQSVRAAILRELLSGKHEIPDSYDDLLETAS